MATKLQIFNQALRYCKERKLSSLNETGEKRRLLDDVWAEGGVDYCLEDAMWKFATRTVRLDYDTTVEPSFGHTRAFQKPDDWVLTVSMCSDEYFDVPLTRYTHENGYWYADLDEVYVKYVSNHDDWGYNLGMWPKSFMNYVSAHFASEIVGKLTGGNTETIDDVEKWLEKNRLKAKNRDAWNQPQQFPAPGSWVSSRGRYRGETLDRGNRGSLLG